MGHPRVVGSVRRAPFRPRRRWRFAPVNLFPILLVGLFLLVEFWPSLPAALSLPSFQRGEIIGDAFAFRFCGAPPHQSCVMDGDTFYFEGESIRIADIDAPETHPPRCGAEAMLGAEATNRLRGLLSSGPFEIRRVGLRDEDRYGRKLRTVHRDGRSLGGVLVAEGLAREWTGRRQPWCS